MIIRILLGTLAIILLVISTTITIVFSIGTVLAFLFSMLAPCYLLLEGMFDILVLGLAVSPFLLILVGRDEDGVGISIPFESMFGFWICSFRFFAIIRWTQYLNLSAILSAIYFTMALLCYLRKIKNINSKELEQEK